MLFFTFSASAANRLLNYGFEDWTGDLETTPGYIFSTGYPSYCDEHKETTEVVTNYDGLLPHTGNYFFLINAGPNMSPMPAGITAWHTESRTNVGYAGNYCGSNPFNIDDIATGEVFLRFYFHVSDWDAVKTNSDAKLKFVRFYEADDVDVMWMVYQNVADNRDPQFGLDGVGNPYYTGTIANFDASGWHRASMYVNYTTGQTALWFDVENESLDNATISHNYGPGGVEGGPTPSPIVIINNWSANNPTENVWFAVDDVEVWDGMPDGSYPAEPSPVIIEPPHVNEPVAN